MDMWFVSVLAIVLTALSAGTSTAAGSTDYDRSSGRVRLTNGRIELVIDTKSGLNPCSLRDAESGRVYADMGYVWPGGKTPALVKGPEVRNASVRFTAAEGPLTIEQTFTAPAKEPGVIVERLTIRNTGESALDTSEFACGFGKKISDAGGWLKDVAESRFCNVPNRVRTETGELLDYDLNDLTTKEDWFYCMYLGGTRPTPVWGAEAWAWYQGGNALLVSKYSNDAMEWSLLAPTRGDVKDKLLRFGGAGRWKLGDPDGAASLEPGESFTFGETRYQVLDGSWKEAFSEYREYTESKGHKFPKGYNPPVHWNELYDNPTWWVDGGDSVANREKHYHRKDMAIEAQKAKEFGCEALYLDPGWDTILGSNIWADDRLGTEDDFIKWLKDEYGIKLLALHTPLAPWTDPSAYPDEARRMDKEGKRLDQVCTASPQYYNEKIARLQKLCANPACIFLMYDGSQFPGECWDPGHGHSLPCTHQEHVDAILHMQQELHKKYPKVLIEQHDPMTGPCCTRYAPTYFNHAKPGAWDELWGLEYMWQPFDDLASHRAHALYYWNLAYSIPIYLHFDMRSDNKNAVLFWWFASTCRHLGLGGKHKDLAVWEAQKSAMQLYMKNKRFFTQGTFYSIDENVHIHTLADKRECVINCFNLTDAAMKREYKLRLADIGLPSGTVKVEGADCKSDGNKVTLSVEIPAMAHRFVKLSVR